MYDHMKRMLAVALSALLILTAPLGALADDGLTGEEGGDLLSLQLGDDSSSLEGGGDALDPQKTQIEGDSDSKGKIADYSLGDTLIDQDGGNDGGKLAVALSGSFSDECARLSWTGPEVAASYRVEAQGPGDADFTLVEASLSATSYAYPCHNTADGAFIFRVTGLDADGNPIKGASATKSVAAPMKLTSAAFTARYDGGVKLSWQQVAGAAGYRLTVTGKGGVNVVALDAQTRYADYTLDEALVLPGDSLTITFGTLSESGTLLRSYTAPALDIPGEWAEGGDSGGSPDAPPALATPANVQVTKGEGTTAVITWDPVEGADGYRVTRGDGQVATTTDTRYVDSAIRYLTDYTYSVAAYKGVLGIETFSAESAFFPLGALKAPAVSNFAATWNESAQRVDFTWDAYPIGDTYGAQGIRIVGSGMNNGVVMEYETSSPTGGSLALGTKLVLSDESSSEEFVFVRGDNYFFIATPYAIFADGNKGYGADIAGGMASVPAVAPLSVTATADSATSITVAWDNGGQSARSFDVARLNAAGEAMGAPVSVPAKEAHTYTFTDLSAATGYQFSVCSTPMNAATKTAQTYSEVVYLPPQTPAIASATATGPRSVALAWSGAGADLTYRVERSVSGGTFTVLDVVDATEYVDTTATPLLENTYRVTAISTAAGESAASQTASATPAIGAPTGAEASLVAGGGARVTWTAATGATIYRVSYGTAANAMTPAATTDTGALDLSADLLTPGQAYLFRVEAGIAYEGENIFDTQNAVTTATPLTIPEPSSLAVRAASSGPDTIQVAWTLKDSQNPTGGYALYTAAGGGAPVQAATVASGAAREASLTGLTAGTQYTVYLVPLPMEAGTTATDYPSATALTGLGAPAQATATAAGPRSVGLTWTAVEGATGYFIERSVNGGAPVSLTATLTNSLTDTSALPYQTYTYHISAYKQLDSATRASSATVISNAVTGALADVTGVTAAVNVAADGISLSWKAVEGADGYIVFAKAPSASGFSEVKDVTAASAVLTGADDLTGGVLYTFRVLAYAGGGATRLHAQTPGESAATGALPVKVTASLKAATAQSATIAWTVNRAAPGGYQILRAAAGKADYTALGTLAQSAASYVDTSAKAGASYDYKIQPLPESVGAASAAVRASLPAQDTGEKPKDPVAPATPTGLKATASSAPVVVLSWTATSGATGYRVARATGSGAYTPIGTVTSPSFTDATASLNTQYYYTVTALGTGDLQSAASSAVPAMISLTLGGMVTATATGPATVSLSWPKAPLATGYLIERSTNAGASFSRLVQLPSGATTSYQDGSLTAGTTYYYRVTPQYTGGGATVSGLYGQVSATTAASGTRVNTTGTGLTPGGSTSGGSSKTGSSASGGSSKTGSSSGSSGSSGSANKISSSGGSTPSGGVSAASMAGIQTKPSASANTGATSDNPMGFATGSGAGAAPAATSAGSVAGVSVSRASSSSVSLAWQPAADATGYLIARSATPDGPYTQVAELTAGETAYVDAAAAAAPGAYYYTITPVTPAGQGVASEPIAVTGELAAVATLAMETDEAGIVSLNWTPVEGATEYHIYARVGEAEPWGRVAVLFGGERDGFVDELGGEYIDGLTYFVSAAARQSGTDELYDAMGGLDASLAYSAAQGWVLTYTDGDGQVHANTAAADTLAGKSALAIVAGADGTYALVAVTADTLPEGAKPVLALDESGLGEEDMRFGTPSDAVA